MISRMSAVGISWSIKVIIISWSILRKVVGSLRSSISIIKVSELRSVLVFIELVRECVLISMQSTLIIILRATMSVLTISKPLLTWVEISIISPSEIGLAQVVYFSGIIEMSKLRSVLVFVSLILERESWWFDIIA